MATHDWPRGPATSPFPRRLCSSAHQKVYDRFPASFVLHHVVPITLTLWQWILIDSIIPAQCRESERARTQSLRHAAEDMGLYSANAMPMLNDGPRVVRSHDDG